MATDKKLFAVIAADDSIKMSAKLVAEFPDTHLSVAEGQWLLVGASTMTTIELSKKLGLIDDTGIMPAEHTGAAIILSVSNYYGRASRTIWEWITVKLGGYDGTSG